MNRTFIQAVAIFVFTLVFTLSGVLFASPVKIDDSENLPKSIKELLYEEQVLHNKDLWPAGAFSSDIDPAYVPENRPRFKLAYYLIPEGFGQFLKTQGLDLQVEKQIVKIEKGKRYYKLFVHPESEAHYEFLKGQVEYVNQEKSEFTASPTSSYRSLMVWQDHDSSKKPFIAKVSLDRNVIGTIDRLVSENEVVRSIANQNAFEKLEKQGQKSVEIYPETAGLYFDKNKFPVSPKKIGGQLIREIPHQVISGQKKIVGLSTVLSPLRNPKPMLVQMVENTKMPVIEFIDKYFIESYMSMFEEVTFKKGINFEPHSQNLSIELTSDLVPTGNWVIRDFGGVWPDVVTMMSNNDLAVIYRGEGSAESHKLKGGRVNAISSFVFFYKRQVYDFVISQLEPHFPELKLGKVKLEKKIYSRYTVLLKKYYDLNLEVWPTMQNYKSIERALSENSNFNPQNSRFQKIPLDSNIEIINSKIDKNEWIFLKTTSASDSLYISPDGLVRVDTQNKIVGFGLLNESEMQKLKLNPVFKSLEKKAGASHMCEMIFSKGA